MHATSRHYYYLCSIIEMLEILKRNCNLQRKVCIELLYHVYYLTV